MITSLPHAEPSTITDPGALTALISRNNALRAIALIYPHIVLIQLALAHTLPHALRLTLAAQVAIMIALLIIWAVHQKRANRLVRAAAHHADGLLCPSCLYPMIEHPAPPPPRATCPECGSTTPSNALRAAWQRGTPNPASGSIDAIVEPQRHAPLPASTTRPASPANRALRTHRPPN